MLLSLRSPLATCCTPSSSLSTRGSSRISGSRLYTHRRQAVRSRSRLQVQAFKIGEHKWWEEHTAPNVVHITSAKDLVEKMEAAGDSLVILDFYAKGCVACRAMFPELVKVARKNPDVTVLCICYDENKELCQAMGVKTIPFFHMYRSKVKVASFAAGVSKIWMVKEAIAKYRPLPVL